MSERCALFRRFLRKTRGTKDRRKTLRMDVESLFTSGGESTGKGVSVSVWQAEVALRLSKYSFVHLMIKLS